MGDNGLTLFCWLGALLLLWGVMQVFCLTSFKLSDAAIMDRLWPDGMGNYDSFQQALRRVRDDVGKESLIELKRAEPGIYKLYI